MIRQFRVQNFKALRDVTLDLTPIHVLVGPNDSGKSSILQALGGLCRSVDHPIEEAFVGRWIAPELVNWEGRGEPVTLSATVDHDEGELTYEQRLDLSSPDSSRRALSERLINPTTQELFAGPWCDNEQTILSLSRHRTNFVKNNYGEADAAAVENLRKAISPVAFVRFTAGNLALPSALNPQRGYRLEPSGFGLPALLDTILSEDRARFIALEDRLKQIFPEIESIQIPPSQAFDAPVDPSSMELELRKTVGKCLRIRFKGQAQPVPASQLSDGILYVLGYLSLLYSPEAPRVLLIEEPENGLHPERLAEIIKILRELVAEHPGTQILMTTHSPYLVDDFEPEEVTACYRDPEGDVKVKRLDRSNLVKRQMSVFNLGEIWAAEGEKAVIEDAQTETPQEVLR